MADKVDGGTASQGKEPATTDVPESNPPASSGTGLHVTRRALRRVWKTIREFQIATEESPREDDRSVADLVDDIEQAFANLLAQQATHSPTDQQVILFSLTSQELQALQDGFAKYNERCTVGSRLKELEDAEEWPEDARESVVYFAEGWQGADSAISTLQRAVHRHFRPEPAVRDPGPPPHRRSIWFPLWKQQREAYEAAQPQRKPTD